MIMHRVFWCFTTVVALQSAFAQYEVFIGDRDLQQGVLRYNPGTNALSVYGACSSAGTRFYYGLEFHKTTGDLWACDLLAGRIVHLDSNGNCIATYPTPIGSPTGLSIHPSGRYLHVTFQNNQIATFDLITNSFVGTSAIPGASGLYGIQWSPGGVLHACDFYGGQIFVLGFTPPNTFNVVASAPTPNFNPYDVAVRHQTGGRGPIDYLYITYSQGFYGPSSQIATAGYAYDTPGFLPTPSLFVQHPQNGSGNVSFFGITYEPSDNSLWVSDYVRGSLYQVTGLFTTPVVTQRTTFGGKPGVGIDTRRAGCRPHNGDVNSDACVDDADLLAVLFAFGQSGSNLGRVDVNCDGIVDDADLLIVLFNFGQGC